MSNDNINKKLKVHQLRKIDQNKIIILLLVTVFIIVLLDVNIQNKHPIRVGNPTFNI